MILKDVLKDIEILDYKGNLEVEITNITSDSRNVEPFGLFVAIIGYVLDGTKFIPDAIKNGASTIMVDETVDISTISVPDNVCVVKVNNIRHALGIASCNLYDYPSKKLKLIGVTGTKGKTTSTYMIKSILQQAGIKVGLIGSIAIYINDEKIEEMDRTSAESYKLQKTLAMMVEKNVDIVVLEVSSQAMKLDRVIGCDFDRVLFTNLSEDHISPNEHKDMEDYFNAKLSLCKMSPIVAYNPDNEYTSRIPNLLSEKELISFGLKNKANIMAKDLNLSNSGVDFTLIKENNELPVHISIPGKYMVYNALGAIAIASTFDVSDKHIQDGLKNVRVFGRSELVPNKLGLTIIIDYAHTPSSLQSILETVKPYTKGRVICTWGVGGDRDSKKRPIMGEISGRLADFTILTCDQIRTESPKQILSDIEEGLKKVTNQYTIIYNRTEAIRHAIKMATKDDIIVLPGLGSDLYIEYMRVKYPYDERVVIHDIIEEILSEDEYKTNYEIENIMKDFDFTMKGGHEYMNIEEKEEEKKEKDIEVVNGDGKDLEISPVYDHIKMDKNNNQNNNKNEKIVIPENKKN